ncbi:MAG TPA: hypothetical protein VMI75_09790 [Polyangiaceae bacterium]|nr:hypothetical protein [Polyangiaceae bacterium]
MNQPYPAQYPPQQYPPQHPPTLTAQDESNLNVLGVLFFVYAGLVGIGALLLSALAVVPALLISGAAAGGKTPGAPPPMLFGGIFAAIFGLVALFLAAKCIIMILAGRALGRRQHYVLIMVGACTALLNLPFGTALGVCTILMLQKPAVKVAFGMA